MIYLSSSGYDPQSRQNREKQKQGHSVNQSKDGKLPDRRVPFKFTGCLAHVEITERESDGEITRIAGHFEHNQECQTSTLSRLPAVPLHDHVYEVALDQLENGAK